MTAKQLRAVGWLVFFRDGWVISYKGTHLRNALRLPVNNGEWMEKAEHPGNWEQFVLTDGQRLELTALRKVCYCSSLGDGNCDFCTQTRRHELEDEIKRIVQVGLDYFHFPNWAGTVAKANPSSSMKQPTIEALNEKITSVCLSVRTNKRSLVIVWDDEKQFCTSSANFVTPESVYATIKPRWDEESQSFTADICEGPMAKSLAVQTRA